MTLNLRKAQIEDVPAIVSLVHSAYRGESSRQGWTTEADLLDGTRTDEQEVAELINQSENYILLYERDGQLQASVHLAQRGTHAYLGMFAVAPTMQGQGIGKQLLGAAETLVLEEWGCESLQMAVISLREELIEWYVRRGYNKTSQIVDFPYGIPRYGFPRRDDLELVVLEKRLDK